MSEKTYGLHFTAKELEAPGLPLEVVQTKIKELQRIARRDSLAERTSEKLTWVHTLRPTNDDVEEQLSQLLTDLVNRGRRADRVFLPTHLHRRLAVAYNTPSDTSCFMLATPVGSLPVYRHTAANIEVHCP